MRILSTVLCGVVGAGMLLLPLPALAGAGSAEGPTAPIAAAASAEALPSGDPLPGTGEEAREYERRQAEAPAEVLDYSGGTVVIGVSLLGVALIVIIVILITNAD